VEFNEAQFGKTLDAKYEQWLVQSAEEMEDADVRNRVLQLEELAKTYKYRCGNCSYPIVDTNYRVLGYGEVCRLCYDMYHTVHDRAAFVEAHRKWKAAIDEEEQRQKDKEDDPYGY